MATRFMRVDLSDEARDFRPVALEPGVPLLDKSGANSKILFRWLGGLTAEPSWEGESVNFFVRDDHGGRLEEVYCQPTTEDEMQKLLQDDIAMLRERIEKAKPETPTERALKRTLRQQYQEIFDNPDAMNLDSCVFRYKDANGNWRLVWCWGFQRADQEPAPAVVCGDDECNLLFVRRPGQSPKCPACQALLSTRPRGKKKITKRRVGIALILLPLLLFALWYFWPIKLKVTPGDYSGLVGTRITFKVKKGKLFWSEDVTKQAVGIVLDPAVARLNPMGASATLVGIGQTKILFHLGDLTGYVVITAGPPRNPETLVIEPSKVDLATGSTARLKLIGKYDDGTEADLTEAAEWVAQNDGICFAYDSLLEGVGPGASSAKVQYRATPDSPYVSAECPVNVADAEWENLSLNIDPTPVSIGRASDLAITATATDGSEYSVAEASHLDVNVIKPTAATVEGSYITGWHAGQAEVETKYKGTAAGEPIDIQYSEGLKTLVVEPKELRMVVGEITDLNILSPSQAPVRVSSANRKKIEVNGQNRLIARQEGETEVIVRQGSQTREVKVKITKADFSGIYIDPGTVAVLVDHTVRPRVMAQIGAVIPSESTAAEPAAEESPAEESPAEESPAEEPPAEETAAESGEEGEEGEEGKSGEEAPPEPDEPVESPSAPMVARSVEIAPDLLTVEAEPSPRFAVFNARKMELLGIAPTQGKSPQKLSFYFEGHQASAPVDVIVAPMRLEVTPPGPIELPLGQQMRPAGLATYTGGHRVQVMAGRMTFESEAPSDAVEGLELRDGSRVVALKAGAGPLNVYGIYFDNKSAPVKFTSVEAGDVTLHLNVDRTIRLVGEYGLVTMSGTSPKGDVDLIPELCKFESSDASIIKIENETTGRFKALATGAATITGTHPASKKEPAKLTLHVYDPDKARLAFDPSSVQLRVNEAAEMQLYLEVEDDTGATQRAPLHGPGIGYAIEEPDAVDWSPPRLIGLEPADPFDLSASYTVLNSPARATITVGEKGEPSGLRVVPGEKDLAAGQTITFKLEEQLPDEPEVWREVNPVAVAWEYPHELIWEQARKDLRPAATIPDGGPAEYVVKAKYGGQEAGALLNVVDTGPDPNDPAATVKIVHEPITDYLAVGHSQRYGAVIEKEGTVQPATGIVWPENFENEYVRWEAPIMTAKKAGHSQWMRAQVGDRNVLWHIITYEPAKYKEAVRKEGAPDKVVFLSDQDLDKIEFPVGAEFNDFEVFAEYDGFMRKVSNKAIIRPSKSIVTPRDGRLIGLQAGQVTVSAEFDGVTVEEPLQCTVTKDISITQLKILPSPVTIERGESYPVEATGYKGEKSVGVLSKIGGMTWMSANPSIASVNGPTVTGAQDGNTTITAQIAGVTSNPDDVHVGPIADALVITPAELQIRVGQSVRVGYDVSLFRREMDLSKVCTVTPRFSQIVRYVPYDRSLVGVAPGSTPVTFLYGTKMVNMTVKVIPGAPLKGDVVIEPANSILSPGQSLPLRVYIQTPTGEKIDRTHSSIFRLPNPQDGQYVRLETSRVCALGPTSAPVQVQVAVAGSKTGTASVSVDSNQITRLLCQPSPMMLSPGDRRPLTILGQSASGTHEMFPQSKLQVAAGAPGVIQIEGGHQVHAIQQGQSNVNVNWEALSQTVPVTVGGGLVNDLRIDPPSATIGRGQPLAYTVTAIRDGMRTVLTKGQGVQLSVSNPSVAQVAPNELAVLGTNLGRTAVIARVGGQTAEASLDVADVPVGMLAGGPVIHSDDTGVYQGFVDNVVVDDGGLYVDPGAGVWTDVFGADQVVIDEGYGGYVVDGGLALGEAVQPGLYFQPEALHIPMGSPGVPFQVVQVMADGSTIDVTNDPNLTLSDPSQAVTRQGNVLRPIAPGQVTIAAHMGPELLAPPLLVSVGEGVAVGGAGGALIVTPNPLNVWMGEMGKFGSVQIDPGNGQLPYEAENYVVTPDPGQGIVSSAGENLVQGNAVGMANVTISVPSQGLSTVAQVQVTANAPIRIEPPVIQLSKGQASPPIAVMMDGPNGSEGVPATLESLDASVVAPEEPFRGRFVATGHGQTQIRAEFRGATATAEVTVSGNRFMQVTETINESGTHFSVALQVLAAASEGALQYRVYEAGQPPAETWVPAQMAGDTQSVMINSPQIARRGPDSIYNFVIEAKDATGLPQQYPIMFREGRGAITREGAQPPPNAPMPNMPMPNTPVPNTSVPDEFPP